MNPTLAIPFTDNLPSDLMAAIQEAADKAAKGVRDPEQAKQARASMDRIREEIRRDHGVLNIGVPAIRELRDE